MKRVYTFGNGKAEGRADMKNLLGGKGANLAEMNLIGVPVPPGFTITTEVCTTYTQQGKEAVVKEIKGDVEKAIAHRKPHGHEVRRCLESAIGIGSFGSSCFHARHDGHSIELRYERRCRRSHC